MTLDECMRHYQVAKKEYRHARTAEKRAWWAQDMDYWHQKLLAEGAMSLQMAMEPPKWLMVGPIGAILKNRRDKAAIKVREMEADGLPNFGDRI